MPFSSSPQAFRTAWDLRSEQLSVYDAETLIEQGAQLIPNIDKSRVFECVQQGVELGINKRLVQYVRHSEGSYDDELNDLGQFTYQPPRDTTGMLRYRLCQYLADSLNISYILIAIMWFKYHVSKDINHVFVICPAKIIDYSDDLVDLNHSLHNPLMLQLVKRNEAYGALNFYSTLNESDYEIDTRPPLSDRTAREWSYDKINNSDKGRRIKRWARESGKKCPGCEKEFKDIASLSHIAFGHIIPQNWSKAFTYFSDRVNHPDNLYLTCRSCNSSLSDNFPDRGMRERIIGYQTIGDWLRNNESDIREI
jgi:hypothetical protein